MYNIHVCVCVYLSGSALTAGHGTQAGGGGEGDWLCQDDPQELQCSGGEVTPPSTSHQVFSMSSITTSIT